MSTKDDTISFKSKSALKRWMRGLTPEPIMPSQDPTTIAQNYRRLIESAIEETCQRRIAEIEGRLPSVEDVKRRLAVHLSDKRHDTRVLFVWRHNGVDTPICQFTPATYTLEGWRDAVVCELRPSREIVEEMKTVKEVALHVEEATR